MTLHPRRLAIASFVLPAALCLAAARADEAEKPADKPDEAHVHAEKEIKKLRQQAELREQELQAQLADLKSQKTKLEAELALINAKQAYDAEPDKAKLEALQRAQQMRDAVLKNELAPNAAEIERLKQGQSLAQAKLDAELSTNKAEIDRLRSQQDLLEAQHRVKIAGTKREQEALAAENALAAEKRKAEQSRMADEQMRAEIEARTASALLQQRDGADKLGDLVKAPVPYTDQPFKDGVLTISDRKIELDGPIMSGSADYVCDRIDYFNNQDRTKPIFIVINNSPGGSVMQGYRILKAVETSDAPVHVVVKSFAASMAATIATLAPHSYAYPNAIILHHQMSSSASGNMTDIEQEVKTMQEWERRLAVPIANKMGITLDEFKARMYSAKKSGDWDEFADKAVQLKWIDHIVNEIREEGIRRKPADKPMSPLWMMFMERDEQGRPYMRLPPLEPYDAYFMVNPRGFYRIDGR